MAILVEVFFYGKEMLSWRGKCRKWQDTGVLENALDKYE